MYQQSTALHSIITIMHPHPLCTPPLLLGLCTCPSQLPQVGALVSRVEDDKVPDNNSWRFPSPHRIAFLFFSHLFYHGLREWSRSTIFSEHPDHHTELAPRHGSTYRTSSRLFTHPYTSAPPTPASLFPTHLLSRLFYPHRNLTIVQTTAHARVRY